MVESKRHNASGIQALAQAANRIAHANLRIERTEKELESEIQRDNREVPTAVIPKIRHYGEKFIHSKHVLLTIVLLNVLDCVLVLGELILDTYHVKSILETTTQIQAGFLIGMKDRYPVDLSTFTEDDSQKLYDKILSASVQWNTTGGQSEHSVHKREAVTPNTTSQTGLYFGEDDSGHHAYSKEEEIAHSFHYASIAILSILVLMTLIKVFCFGKQFLKMRIEIFDSVIIAASFTLDLVFIKGLTSYHIQTFVLILAFLVPWRVIRVVNSLVVAVLDHEHFLLKLIYKEKKKVENEMKAAKAEVKTKESCINALKLLCAGNGIPEWMVDEQLSRFELSKKNSKENIAKNLASMSVRYGIMGGSIKPKPVMRPPDVVTNGYVKNNDNADDRNFTSGEIVDNTRRGGNGVCSSEVVCNDEMAKDESIYVGSGVNTSNTEAQDNIVTKSCSNSDISVIVDVLPTDTRNIDSAECNGQEIYTTKL